MDKLELMMEADRRGLLPPEQRAMLAEAGKRGLLPVDKVSQIPDKTAPIEPEQPESLLDKARGVGEAGLSLLTGAAGMVPAKLAGMAETIRTGQISGDESAQVADKRAREFAENTTYQPRGQAGKRYLQNVASAFDESKLAGLNPAVANELSAMTAAPKALSRAGTVAVDSIPGARTAVDTAGDVAANIGKPTPQAMPGMGAAMTTQEALRRERAASLPVPIKLTKGEATRDFEQQRFEKETLKNSAYGAPLREHAADNVQKVAQNFEAWVDQSGAEAPDLISVGKAIDRPLVRKMESAKAEIRNAYDKAEKAGEMADKVSVLPLVQFVQENSSSAKLAPVISAIESEMKRLGGLDGAIPAKLPINDVEKIRKLAVRLGKIDDTNGHYAGEANKVIDAMTENAGGDLYKKARTMFKDYAGEFKSQGAVRDLVGKKAGTTDRKIALEDVFNHSVLSGSNQDTQNIIRSLEGAGPEGLQGIRELKGATMNWILGKTTENAARDIRGNPIPSFSKIDKAVRSLDADGKLDLLFGKKGAEQIRDLKELVADIHTAPPGAVNTSTTAAVLMEALGALATGRVPTATAKAIAGIKQAVGDRGTMKRVRESLQDPAEIGAGNNVVH